MGVISRLASWARRRFSQPHFRRVLVINSVADVPERVEGGTIVLVGSERPKWAIFDCPCAAGHRVTLNLQPLHWPVWKVDLRGERVTIWPSVDVRDARRCHYFVIDGVVRWV